MQHKNLTIMGIMVLAALLMFQGCADQSGTEIGSPMASVEVPTVSEENFTTTDRSVLRAAGEIPEFKFEYEIKLATRVVNIDPQAGVLVIDFNPKEVKFDDHSYIFAKGDVAEKFQSSGSGTSASDGATVVKLSVEALGVGSSIVVYADLGGDGTLYAVAIEKLLSAEGPASLVE